MSLQGNFDMPIELGADEARCSEEPAECRWERLVCFNEYIRSADVEALPAEPERLDTGERA